MTARDELQLMVTDALIDQYAQSHHINVAAAEIAKVENQYRAQYPAGQWDQLLKARSDRTGRAGSDPPANHLG